MTRSSSTYIAIAAAAAAAAASLHTSHAFVLPSSTTISPSSSCVTQSPSVYYSPITTNTVTSSSTTLFMSSTPTTSTTSNTLSLQLQKPLGLILEEADDTNPSTSGVIVTQVNEGGSAYTSPSADILTNAKIVKVMETDVSSMSFDDVMDVIIGAPESLCVEFALADGVVVETSTDDETEEASSTTVVEEYEIGTTVTIQVEQPDNNKPSITLEAKVGDNLRKTLLENKDIELYRGLKKKLGNCGGGGQCGFCAVELTDDSESGMVWGTRSEYEDGRIGKKAGTENQRLACMNTIVGPATVKTL